MIPIEPSTDLDVRIFLRNIAQELRGRVVRTAVARNRYDRLAGQLELMAASRNPFQP